MKLKNPKNSLFWVKKTHKAKKAKKKPKTKKKKTPKNPLGWV
jgi:hypothetical protein